MGIRTASEPSLRHFLTGLGRAAGGAIIFALPMLMTMEMWALGFTLDVWKLCLLLVATIPVLLGLSYYGGFRCTFSLKDDLADVFVGMLIAGLMSTFVLWLFGVLTLETSLREAIGKIAVQVVPGGIGAMLARSQFGGDSATDDLRRERSSYWGELFMLATGALFLSFNVAPTEEIILIAFQMDAWREAALALASLLLMHVFVYVSNFKGGDERGAASHLSMFLRFSLTGYVLSLLISMAMLWIFGRSDGLSFYSFLSAALVLGFPASIGAAAARLVL
ncbi:TIGR02587 family membrane protein [Rhizobium sp. G21]|uniref:TIGR02587 family membrane protein n=1 Tax=Rhizobium sp. G21 TaxID=2758439 RepID=UPI0016016173|nr:TIGR02587 family membrane protein [Rhizobium sp. G21]MBB1248831.1 TIGR02587 family membrane protein [Rhizobium sp. G21]